MARDGFMAQQIIPKPRESEVEVAKGRSVAQVFRKLSDTEQTYNGWRRKYGGLESS